MKRGHCCAAGTGKRCCRVCMPDLARARCDAAGDDSMRQTRRKTVQRAAMSKKRIHVCNLDERKTRRHMAQPISFLFLHPPNEF